jgi:hypothetical protein
MISCRTFTACDLDNEEWRPLGGMLCFGNQATIWVKSQIGFVSAFQHTAGDIRQTFVVQDNQACQVMLEMAKLAPILKEIAKDVRVGSHDGSRSDDGKLHKTFALSPKGEGRA